MYRRFNYRFPFDKDFIKNPTFGIYRRPIRYDNDDSSIT
jgi:hypothetical protein